MQRGGVGNLIALVARAVSIAVIRGGLLAFFAFGSSSPASAADMTPPGDAREMEYGYPEQPPRVFTNAQGDPDGSYPRLLKVLLARAGMAWHGASYPAPRLMRNLQRGVTDFSILVKNAALETCCIYSKSNVWYDDLAAYSVGDKPAIKRKEDLIGKEIIAMSGFSYGGMINFLNDPSNNIIINVAESHQAAFTMLEHGRGDYLLDYAEPAEAEGLRRHPVANLRQDVIDRTYMYLVISNKYPNAQSVLDRLESIYSEIYAEDVKREYTKQ
jgi:hypothetical protein